MATQYFAERGIVCISRIPLSTLVLLAKSTSTTIQRSLQYLPTKNITQQPPSTQNHPHKSSPSSQVLGTCREYAMRTIGAQTHHIFSGCTSVATLVLRGGSTSLLGEVPPFYSFLLLFFFPLLLLLLFVL